MKQIIRKGLKDIIVDEVPDPFAGPHHVLVRPAYSLISSGTETADIHKDGILKEVAENPSHLRKVYDVLRKTHPIPTIREIFAKFSDYAVLGYSGAGIVVDVHPTVKDISIGQRVAYGGEGTGHGETLCIGRNLAARIPDEVPFKHACFTTLGAIAMNAVRQANIQVGDNVTVIGLGLVGQLVAQIARCQGALVIATDLIESRVKLATECGADHGIRGGDGLRDEILALTQGRGSDVVIVAAASKSSRPVQEAVKICRDRGRIVIVGIMPIEMEHSEMYMKELKVSMARAYGPGSYDEKYEKDGIDYPLPYVRWTENRNMEEFLRLMSAGKVNVEPLISHEFELEQGPKAYDTIMDGKTDSLAVLLRYPASVLDNPVMEFSPKRRIDISPESNRTANGRVRSGKDINFAIIGAGNLVRWEHLPAIAKINGCRTRAIYSARGAKGKGYGIRFKADYVTSDYNEILNDDQTDVVLIASRHSSHAREVLAALNKGKDILVEKPLAISIEECKDIIAAVKRSGRTLSVGFNRRFAPCYVMVRKQIEKRNGPAVINIRMNASYMKDGFWGASLEEGGAVLGEAVHMVDLMRYLLAVEPITVSAFSFPTNQQEPVGENNIVASIKFEDGSIGNLTYCTVGSDASAGELVEVFINGLGISSQNFKRVVVERKSRKTLFSSFWPQKGYLEQMKAFVDAIHNDRKPEVTELDGAMATLVCAKMLQSAKNGGSPHNIDISDLM